MSASERMFTMVAADQVGSDDRQWIEVMPTTGEAVKNGDRKFVVDPADLEVYAQSIRDSAGKIVVDYDHAGAEPGGSTRAAGWFTGSAEVRTTDRGPILCAEVQWTPAAAQAIRDHEYRFVSAEFSFHNRDSKTGLLSKAKEILASTLTNRPFFRDLEPVAARLNDAQVDAIATALNVDRDLVVAAAASATTPTREGDTQMAFPEGILRRLGLTADADEATVLAAIDEKLEATEKTETTETKTETVEKTAPAEGDEKEETDDKTAEAAAEKTQPSNELLEHANKQLASRVELLEKQLADREEAETKKRRDTLVAAAASSGRILPSEHDLYRTNLDINEEGTTKVLASLPAGRVPVAERGTAPSATSEAAETGWFPQFENKKETVNG